MLSSCNGGGSTTPVYTQTQVNGVDTLANTSRGKKIFETRCVACHGIYGNARVENAANLQISRIDSPAIVLTIQNGRGNMPMFKDAMPDSDLAQLVSYVKSLRK